MCGLVGVAGFLQLKDEKAMKRLLLLDYFRGMDSTGFASIRRDGESHIAKVSSHPLDLFDMLQFKTALNGAASQIFIGHNRAATRGKISKANAHPFEFGNIIGTHNGTLDTESWHALEKALGHSFEVDSQALIAAIAEMGVKEAISMVSGAWALVYYDGSNHTLNFLRNDERPLWHCFTEDFKRLLWASEWPMLRATAELDKTYDLYTDKEGFKYFEFEKDVHYTFDVSTLVKGGNTRPKPVASVVKGKEVTTRKIGGAYGAPFARSGPRQPTITLGRDRSTTSKTSGRTSSSTRTIFHLVGSPADPFGGMIPKEKFETLAQYGCSWCTGPVNWGDYGLTIYERDGVVLCHKCSHGEVAEALDLKTPIRIYSPADITG